MCDKLKRVKFQPCSARETLKTGGRKMCVFRRKTGHISETMRNMAKVTI